MAPPLPVVGAPPLPAVSVAPLSTTALRAISSKNPLSTSLYFYFFLLCSLFTFHYFPFFSIAASPFLKDAPLFFLFFFFLSFPFFFIYFCCWSEKKKCRLGLPLRKGWEGGGSIGCMWGICLSTGNLEKIAMFESFLISRFFPMHFLQFFFSTPSVVYSSMFLKVFKLR